MNIENMTLSDVRQIIAEKGAKIGLNPNECELAIKLIGLLNKEDSHRPRLVYSKILHHVFGGDIAAKAIELGIEEQKQKEKEQKRKDEWCWGRRHGNP